MYTTVDETGVLNNYAPETEIYYAEFPTLEQQRNYISQGAIASLLVCLLILTAFGIS
ncbi:MAG: ssl1498 family light-harvesting-like protein [Moorea sp. SIO3A2]|nr:ssl1498 family light-harvesting-like protein [Moorena sp. SIO3A2]NER86188.1 ssl1498 family light-harvesting-like protein [Moorena sp. SIO3A2]